MSAVLRTHSTWFLPRSNPWYWIDRPIWWDSEQISQATWAGEIREAKIKASRSSSHNPPSSNPDKRMRQTNIYYSQAEAQPAGSAEAIIAVGIPDEICQKMYCRTGES